MVPDPAFTLRYDKSNLPLAYRQRNIIGINISPMVQGQESISGITLKNYQKLIDYIINTTDMEVLLIPHVIWRENDDRVPLRKIYDVYKECTRVQMIEDQDCTKLKEIISCCRFFIGARTHATIAAYSTGVPTIVVGYSVKAKGIAIDLFGTDKNFVLPVQSISNPDELLEAFKWLAAHEVEIKNMLKKATRENTIKKYKLIIAAIKNLM